ncbi:MAG TPA: MobF family relaxase [Acidimicrobiales bacterium]|nr:MobF family relaxase [Acidimicrobiales bacterium]
MGLAKIAPDGWAYYAKEVAAGVEDYFVGHGEETGRWVGRGADDLGLFGEVDSEGLSRLFGQGCHPVTADSLGRPFGSDKAAVAGYALSFSPPKSVSVLWALAPAEIADQVRQGHDAAVAAALEFLQDHAGFCRRGHGGTVQEATGGYLAALFVHRTSRAGDPQLHSHVLVANKVHAVSDRRWLTVDGRELSEVQKAAGLLYKAALRAELTARLGVAWDDVDDNGGAEIIGVPEGLIGEFSKRRVQVEAAAARLAGEREAALGRSLTGDERAAVYQLAAYQSRSAKRKNGAETTDELKARWRSEAAAAGLPTERWLGQVLDRRSATKVELALARMGVKPSLELVLAEAIDRLERSHSTWGRAQAVEVLSVVLPSHKTGTAGRVRQVVEAAADMLLAHPDVVGLSCPDRPDARHGSPRYSTWWTLQTEQAVLDAVEAGRTAQVAVAPIHRVLTDASLGEDQEQAVRRLCGGGERVAVLIGPAGSGKSRTLRAAREAWEQAGIPVRGVAPSAVGAGVLTEQAGIASDTFAKFLLEVAHRRTTINPGEVIVCDEASMVSTRDLARLVLLADAVGAKVVLVGDHYQLGSVDAGGLFRLLAADAKTAELTGVRRFTDPWEAQATRRLRHADPSVIDEYTQRDRVRAGDRDQALETAHHAWKDGREHGRSVVVMAADRDTVDQLAMRARASRVHTGQVEAGGITVGNQTVGVGDEIVSTRNDRRLVTTTGAWVRNGDRWTVDQRHQSGALLIRSLDGRGTVTVPGDYVHEHVGLAYAVTVHRSQGLTVDHAVLVVDRSTSAEHLYVAMTRGRHHNLACVITEPPGDEHTHRPLPTPGEVLAAVLRRTSGEKSATETLRDELESLQPQPGLDRPHAIVEGLRQTQNHSYQETIRRQAQRQANAHPGHSHALSVTRGGPEL